MRKAGAAMLACVALGIGACAGTPAPDRAGASASQPAPAAAAQPASSDSVGRQRFVGYRREVRDGREVYCRQGATTGSRLAASDTCYTLEQMRKMEDAAQRSMRDMQNPPQNPAEVDPGPGGY